MNYESNNKIDFIDPNLAISFIEKAMEETTIILDFDETLLLRNSTAEYLDSLRPRWLGFLILKFISLIQPWSWLPKPFKGNRIRDWFLVVGATILLPWTLFFWQHKAKNLALNHGNVELIQAISNNSKSSIIIASLGFSFIIEPVLKHLDVRYSRVIACRFWQGAKDRGKGKLLMMQEVLSGSAIKSSMLVTDSYDDLPLLEVVAKPCLIIWPLAKYNSPLQDIRDSCLAFVKQFSKDKKRES